MYILCYTCRQHANQIVTSRWAGNAVLTYFIGAVLDTAGYHTAIQQTNINLGYSCFQFVFALIGSAFVDKVGRRRLMITGMAGCAVVWVGMTTASGLFNETQNASAAKATVAMIFMFGAIFSFCLTPLQALYPGKFPVSASRKKIEEKTNIITSVVLVVTITKEHVTDCALPSRGVVFRNACQRYGFLKSGCQRRWPTQPIRLACLSQEHWMEDVYCVHRMVHSSDGDHLVVLPRDQEQNCKYLSIFLHITFTDHS